MTEAHDLEAAIARLEQAAAVWFNQDLHKDLQALIAAARRKVSFPKGHSWGSGFNSAVEDLKRNPDAHVADF